MSPLAKADRPILITGGTGQVGSELLKLLTPVGPVVAPNRSELDLANPASIRAVLRDFEPVLILNAGAYTAVDKAESEPDLCHAINAEAPRVLATEARDIDAALIHYSTDYVFDGLKAAPYVEDDPAAPLNAYGRAKAVGEQSVLAFGGATLVLRCSWVYSLHGKNFLTTMLGLRHKPQLAIVDDQHGAPTCASAIAASTCAIIAAARSSASGMQDFIAIHSGIYHLSAAGRTSWKGFAEEIFRTVDGTRPRVEGISTEEYGAPAHRPRNSVLDNSKIATTFGIQMPSWEAQLKNCVDHK
ncbi:MAG: dTDP-4-dehydrorhamnose reductase [Gemmatimonadaceae bacterium]|nr:dTDP-4-dehydrorhamnose reductase [Gemmatimonadaceae bacterium]